MDGCSDGRWDGCGARRPTQARPAGAGLAAAALAAGDSAASLCGGAGRRCGPGEAAVALAQQLPWGTGATAGCGEQTTHMLRAGRQADGRQGAAAAAGRRRALGGPSDTWSTKDAVEPVRTAETRSELLNQSHAAAGDTDC